MPAIYTVEIHYMNGSISKHPFTGYQLARDFCRNGISYSGDRVRRVEVWDIGSSVGQAIWDISWDAISQAAGLRR